MELIHPNTNFDFLGKKKYFITFSLVMLTLSLVSFAVRGLRYGVDFAGGTVVQIRFQKAVGPEAIRTVLRGQLGGNPVVQSFGSNNEYIIQTEQSTEDLEGLSKRMRDSLSTALSDPGAEVRRVEMVGPKVGKDLRKKGALSVLVSMVGILAYIWLRFEFSFSAGGVLALFHDVIVTLGAVSLLGIEFDLTGLAAILTIAGYSINDTIVIFDRIRENMKKSGNKGDLEVTMNRSVNETLSRSVLTVGTVLLIAVSLFFLGGPVIHNFALIMLVGVGYGCYSSIYIASPIALWIDKRADRKKLARAAA
ncbi:MAG: protein translocase subunit SecF [Deltaproteobacteria bacterium]|nr:protein translocase subunit SecF [Deltaproteobacteria bacterium]